jgi:hypothetical protein
MTFRNVAIAALCAVALIALIDATFAEHLQPQGLFWYSAIVRTALLALVAIAAAAAASRFNWWSEYAGRSWTLFFIAYSILTASELARRFLPQVGAAREVLVAVGNVAIIGAYWLASRSLKVAGLDFQSSTARRIVVIVLALGLALALCWGSFWSEIVSARAGELHIGSLISVLADMITFVLVAPLLLTAFALRGGRLFWIFALLTTGTFGWMVNQGSSSVLRAVGWQEAIRTGRMLGFALACCFISAAAFTQWLAVRRGTSVASHA